MLYALRDYVVKGKQVANRALVTEQIVGALGELLGAPVPRMPLVDVPAELIASEPQIGHLSAGVAHGCLYVPNCGGRMWGVQYCDEPVNRQRHARLAILYGCVQPADQQVYYELSQPPRVWSWDHGGFSFLAGGPAAPYQDIVRDGKLTAQDLATVKPDLEAIGPDKIAQVVARPHESWGLSLDERVAFAQDLEKKRTELIASLA